MEQADRITIMKDGCLVKEVHVSEITKEEMINQMAGKKVQITGRVQRKVSDEVFLRPEIFPEKGSSRM